MRCDFPAFVGKSAFTGLSEAFHWRRTGGRRGWRHLQGCLHRGIRQQGKAELIVAELSIGVTVRRPHAHEAAGVVHKHKVHAILEAVEVAHLVASAKQVHSCPDLRTCARHPPWTRTRAAQGASVGQAHACLLGTCSWDTPAPTWRPQKAMGREEGGGGGDPSNAPRYPPHLRTPRTVEQ